MTERFETYKKLVDLLMENNHFRSDSEFLAGRIMKEIFPEQEAIVLEECPQCSGKGYFVFTVKHGGMSSSTYRAVCGFCFGTGKLSKERMEYT